MTIEKTLNNQELIIKPIGEINTVTAPEVEEVIKNDLGNITSLIFDFSELEYLSSAGLRVLLVAQKLMNKKGTMSLRHVNNSVKEIFDITGFSNILDIQD
ncbi:MAG: STAS domain-containing protein [Bacilli bacterium]|nr:STAS domain-containing protein [Bacilli bacterium]